MLLQEAGFGIGKYISLDKKINYYKPKPAASKKGYLPRQKK